MTENEEEELIRKPIPEKGKGCWYPMWGECSPTHIYCDEPREEGSSYCSDHHSIVYVRGSGNNLFRKQEA
jgi:hypothetical protein